MKKFYDTLDEMYIEVFKAGSDVVLNFNQDPNEIHRMIGDVVCLCCNSILCPNKWCATRNIKEIADEFVRITTLKARAQERIFCNRIQEKLFNCIRDKDGKVSLNCLPLGDYRISDFL